MKVTGWEKGMGTRRKDGRERKRKMWGGDHEESQLFKTLLCLDIFSPNNKGLPHPKVGKCWNLNKAFIVLVLLLPALQSSKLCFIVSHVSDSFTADCVVVGMVDFTMFDNPDEIRFWLLVESCNVFIFYNTVLYIEDITRWCEDMNFIFEWQNNILRTSTASE